MNKQWKTILYIAGFFLSLAVAGLAYRYLSTKYTAQKPLLEATPTPTASYQAASPDASNTAPSPEASPGQTEDAEDTDNQEDERTKAPDFTVYDAEGNAVKLSDYLGVPVVLNFWASWCPPCKSEMPDFNKVSQEYDPEELQFLMIDLVDGDRETVKSGQDYIRSQGYVFTVLYDTSQEAAYTYGVRSIPTTYFIDSKGYLVTGAEGAIDEETLRIGIDMILK